MENPWQDLWGCISDSIIYAWMLPCMAIAVTGYLIFTWFFLVKWDPNLVEDLQWPWYQPTSEVNQALVGGHARLLLAYMFFLVPSILWLELTILHLQYRKIWSQVLVIGNLWLVCIGNILMVLLAWSAHRQFSHQVGTKTIWPIIGSLMLGLQCIINDGIVWNVKFPWFNPCSVGEVA